MEDCSEPSPEIPKIRDSTEVVFVEGPVSKGADTTEKQVKTCAESKQEKVLEVQSEVASVEPGTGTGEIEST